MEELLNRMGELSLEEVRGRAATLLKKNLSPWEDMPEFFFRLALHFDDAQRREDAIFFYRLAWTVSDCHKAVNNIAVLYADSGRTDDAIAILREGVRLFPDDPSLRENLDYLTCS
jgi:Flp pilus assembly protein TadD